MKSSYQWIRFFFCYHPILILQLAYTNKSLLLPWISCVSLGFIQEILTLHYLLVSARIARILSVSLISLCRRGPLKKMTLKVCIYSLWLVSLPKFIQLYLSDLFSRLCKKRLYIKKLLFKNVGNNLCISSKEHWIVKPLRIM